MLPSLPPPPPLPWSGMIVFVWEKLRFAEAAAKADAVLAASSIVTAALASIDFYAADALRFMSQCIQRQNFFFIFEMFYFSRGHATLHLAVLVSRSVRPSVTFFNSEQFLHYCSCSCSTIRNWIAVYPALFFSKLNKIFHPIYWDRLELWKMKSWWGQVASWSLRDANIFTQ